MSEQFDAIVIGSGQAGGPLSTAMGKAGWKTALIEREHVGGTCINEGCTPTKTMVASARVAYLTRRAADYGVDVGSVTVDMVRVRQRKREIVQSFRQSSEKRIQGTENVELIYGEANFVGPKKVQIKLGNGATRQMEAPRIFINTGTRPAMPHLPGLDQVPTLNSTSVMELDTVPDHLIVLGGGYVGLEFGQMFRRFGSKVTIVEMGKRLMGREDEDVAEEMAKILRGDGLELLMDTKAQQVSRSDGGEIRLSVSTPDGESILAGSHLLVAAGRVPNTDSLNSAATGIQTDERGFIPVNERLESNVPGIYAMGDVKGGPAFTHISYDDFRILRDNLLEGGNASTKGRMVPYTVFTDPQLGRIGLTEQEARAQGRDVKVAKMPMSYIARTSEVGETRGLMKAIVDSGTGEILGAAVLGLEGGELMAMLEIAMMARLPYTTLREAVFAHPTLAEGLNNLFTSLE